MTDVWSERAEAYRESDAHRQGRDLRALRRVGGGRDRSRRGHRRRSCGARAARGGPRSRDDRPGARDEPDRGQPRRGDPVRRFELRRRRLPRRRAPLPGSAGRAEGDGARQPRARARLRQPVPRGSRRGGRPPARSHACPQLFRGGMARHVRRGRARGRGFEREDKRIDFQGWIDRAGTPPEDAARAEELLADRIEEGSWDSTAASSRPRKR